MLKFSRIFEFSSDDRTFQLSLERVPQREEVALEDHVGPEEDEVVGRREACLHVAAVPLERGTQVPTRAEGRAGALDRRQALLVPKDTIE